MSKFEWESLQDLVRKIHNRKVKSKFLKEINETSDTLEGKLKRECLIKDNDNAMMVILRILLFKEYCSDSLDDVINNIIGIPRDDYVIKNKVTLQLKFQEKPPYDTGNTPKRLFISLPIDKDVESITDGDINSLKSVVNSAFPKNYSHYCGKNNYSYYREKYQISHTIPGSSLGSAQSFFVNILSISNERFDDSFLKEHKDANVNKNTGTVRILGETYKKSKGKKYGNVYLKTATLVISNYASVSLIDR